MTEEDGSCDYCSCADGAGEGLNSHDYESNLVGYGLRMERISDRASGALSGMTTWRLFATVPNTTDVVSSVYGNEGLPMAINTTTAFYQDDFGSTFASGVNPLLFGSFPELEYDSWVTIGIDGTPDCLLYTSPSPRDS